MASDFATGRRWRVDSDSPNRYHGIGFEWIIVGSAHKISRPTETDPTAKLCRLVADTHAHTSQCACGHGKLMTNKHAFLKKKSRLLPLDAPPQDAQPLPKAETL